MHYARTCEHWLQNQDENIVEGLLDLQLDALDKGLPEEEAAKTFYR